MKRCQPLLLLWLVAMVSMNILGISHAGNPVVADNKPVKNLKNNNTLQVIPHNSENVTKLVIRDSLISLNEDDREALASYPDLIELQLDGNLVTTIPAKYFSVVPKLQVLTLSRNNISSLDPESFFGLKSLTKLDLSNNLLTSLHTQLFRQLNSLKVLNLEENPWNCSCSLLSSIKEVKAAEVAIGGPKVTCASPENQAGKDLLQVTALCYSSSPSASTKDPQKPTTSVNLQKSSRSSPTLKSIPTSQNETTDQTPVLGNSWKFTACVATLALFTCMLIVCAIKGPSWYKLLYNYRHRRLYQEEDEDTMSTAYSREERFMNHQTFTFQQENGKIEEEEEEEDGYYEDPYIKREE